MQFLQLNLHFLHPQIPVEIRNTLLKNKGYSSNTRRAYLCEIDPFREDSDFIELD